MYKFNTQIELLQIIVNNWQQLTEGTLRFQVIYTLEGRITIDTKHGLCDNCKLNALPRHVFNTMLESWPKYTWDSWYPVGGFNEYLESKNKYTNLKRLELAKHCLEHLRRLVNERAI